MLLDAISVTARVAGRVVLRVVVVATGTARRGRNGCELARILCGTLGNVLPVMGSVYPSVPVDLARRFARVGKITVAVETGTFHASGTLALHGIVPRVLSIEVSERLHRRAVKRYGDRAGLTFVLGSSPDVLPALIDPLDGPVLFWLDAHGGMLAGGRHADELHDPPGAEGQCPLIAELEAIRQFPWADRSCILIDDARAFFGPLPHHRPQDWPPFVNVLDLLRTDSERYVTALDDVIIAVPQDQRPTVDQRWLELTASRNNLEAHAYLYDQALNPTPGVAARRLVKSVVPRRVRDAYYRRRV